MATANWLLVHHLNSISGKHFWARKITKHSVLFENRHGVTENFAVNFEFLNSNEVCEIARIIAEVYENVPEDALRMHGFGTQNLCSGTIDSSKFVSQVLSLRSSTVHKFLLLASGANLNCSQKVLSTLVQCKEDIARNHEPVAFDRKFYELRKYYLLPGFNSQTIKRGYDWIGLNFDISNLEDSARLSSFLADSKSQITLKEHFEKDFSEIAQTKDSMESMTVFNSIQGLLNSKYRELAFTMNPTELMNLGNILRYAQNENFPIEILERRCKALDRVVRPVNPDPEVRDSVKNWLSVSELGEIDDFNASWIDSRLNSHFISRKTPSVIYAAVAELIVTMGQKKALEVVNTLEHLNRPRRDSYKMYAATTWLISEAMLLENGEFPFSWVAELSEHAWVLNSHKTHGSEIPIIIQDMNTLKYLAG